MEQIQEIESLALEQMQENMFTENISENKTDQSNIFPTQANQELNFDDDEEDESDEDVVVTIGEIKSTVPTSYQKPVSGGALGKIELDSNPAYMGTPIYDLDLITMEDKPWRKAGADITDYFNYGFNEDTWNLYCERQRKLRAEYGDKGQETINKALFNSIQLPSSSTISFPTQQSNFQSQQQFSTTVTGGRQLVVIGEGEPVKTEQKVQKIVIDLTKPPPSHLSNNPIPIVRTVIGATGAVLSTQNLMPQGFQANVDEQSNESLQAKSETIIDATQHTDFSLPSTMESQVSQPTHQPISTISSASGIPTTHPQPIHQSTIPQPVVLPQRDFSKPPPTFDVPPPSITVMPSQQQQLPPVSSNQLQPQPSRPLSPPILQPSSQKSTTLIKAELSDLPPGVDLPPGIEPEPPGLSSYSPPPSSTSNRMGIGNFTGMSFGGGSFDPSVPPPPVITAQVPAPLGLQSSALFQQQSSQQFPVQFGGPQFGNYPRLQGSMGHPFRREFRPSYRSSYGMDFGYRRYERDRESSESDTESDHRRKRRKRSRSPSERRRRSDEKHGSREKESKSGRKGDDSKDKEHKKGSRGDREYEESSRRKIKKEKLEED